ncbi:MAG: addiction module protein [Symploca sp. SIO1B1]|nr:addiction module protein [Symploca sp. SIO1C2]NER94508.1 addiction module protein [Symploca sp. SIO1B1]
MLTVDEIFNEALTLPNASRVILVKKLVESLALDEETNPIYQTIQELWIEEAKKRIDEIRSSSVKAIPGEEALAQVRQLLES